MTFELIQEYKDAINPAFGGELDSYKRLTKPLSRVTMHYANQIVTLKEFVELETQIGTVAALEITPTRAPDSVEEYLGCEIAVDDLTKKILKLPFGVQWIIGRMEFEDQIIAQCDRIDYISFFEGFIDVEQYVVKQNSTYKDGVVALRKHLEEGGELPALAMVSVLQRQFHPDFIKQYGLEDYVEG